MFSNCCSFVPIPSSPLYRAPALPYLCVVLLSWRALAGLDLFVANEAYSTQLGWSEGSLVMVTYPVSSLPFLLLCYCTVACVCVITCLEGLFLHNEFILPQKPQNIFLGVSQSEMRNGVTTAFCSAR